MKKLFFTVLALAGLLCAAAQTQDWANFGRFEQANDEVRNPKVVLMGNSITEGWIRLRPGFFAENGYVSRAISGQTTSQMLVRFRADVVELHPRIVVICAGTNDIARNTGRISLEHILDNLQSMVELARANGIRPILCSVPPAGAFGWRPELKPAQDIVRLNGMIRAYADAVIKELDIRCFSAQQHTGTLSGGNQQKVCIARALAMNPRLLFVSEPTRGIDIGAKKLVLETLVRLNREKGMTVVMVSSELMELRSICDRIAIVAEGKVVDVLETDASDADFGLAMSGIKPEHVKKKGGEAHD